MNAERLRRLIDTLVAEEAEQAIQSRLQDLRDSLSQLQGNPGDSGAQHQVSARLAALSDAIVAVSDKLTPQERALAASIGGERYFSPGLIAELQRSISENAMTPAVVHQFVDTLLNERAQFLNSLNQAVAGLAALGIEPETLSPGEAELDILIPREIFHDRLDGLAKELTTINQILNTFSEVRTGKPEVVEVRQISTTDPLFSLAFNTATMVMVGGAITWLLNTWKQALEIKKLRQETAKSPVFTEADLKMFDNKIEAHVEQRINEKVAELLDGRTAAARDNELEGWLKWSLQELLGRIERGMVLEVRFLAAPLPSEDGEGTQDAEGTSVFDALAQLAPQLTYPLTEGPAILKIGSARPTRRKEG